MSGIIILPIFIFYAVVGTILLKLILKAFNKKLNTFFVFLIVLFLPFWDVLGAYVIKAYYEATLKPIIYEYPQRDENGKIESVGASLTGSPVRMTEFTDKKELDSWIKYLKSDNISKFVEFDTMIYKTNDAREKPKYVLVRVNIYNKDKPYEIIDKSQARYIVKYLPKEKPRSLLLFAIFSTKSGVFDTKNDKLLAVSKTISIGTPRFMDTFRNNVLLLPSFRTGHISMWDKTRKELFKDIRIIR